MGGGSSKAAVDEMNHNSGTLEGQTSRSRPSSIPSVGISPLSKRNTPRTPRNTGHYDRPPSPNTPVSAPPRDIIAEDEFPDIEPESPRHTNDSTEGGAGFSPRAAMSGVIPRPGEAPQVSPFERAQTQLQSMSQTSSPTVPSTSPPATKTSFISPEITSQLSFDAGRFRQANHIVSADRVLSGTADKALYESVMDDADEALLESLLGEM